MSERFDALSRGLSESKSRRGALKLIGGAAAAAVGAAVFGAREARGFFFCDSTSVPCGQACCNRGDTCSSRENSCCCPKGTTPCGFSCCDKGVACVDASRSFCGCPAGTTPCGTGVNLTCCPAGTACTSGCPSPSGTSSSCYSFICFTGATRVLMADGSEKRIEDVEPGDEVLGSNGHANLVLRVIKPALGDRELYALNGDDYFVTAAHPFLTTEGWKSIDPVGAAIEHPQVSTGHLQVGDCMLAADTRPADGVCGNVLTATALKTVELTSMRSRADDPALTVYDLTVDGDHTYFANGYVVHNR